MSSRKFQFPYYCVDLWGSDPDLGKDECWTGADFKTEQEARDALADPSIVSESFARIWSSASECEFAVLCLVESDGLSELARQPNPNFSSKARARADREDDLEWRREMANEAGMLHGVQGYNEVMGYDS